MGPKGGVWWRYSGSKGYQDFHWTSLLAPRGVGMAGLNPSRLFRRNKGRTGVKVSLRVTEREEDQRHGPGEVAQEGGGFSLALASSSKEKAWFSVLPEQLCLGSVVLAGVGKACVRFSRFNQVLPD